MQTNEEIKVPNMDKLTFKYDVMHLFDDRYEFRRFKKKPFCGILRDMFINRLVFYALTGVSLYLVLFIPIMYLINIPIEDYIFGPIGSVTFFIAFAIITYFEQHKNATMLISHIQNASISKDKKTLQIEYNNGKYTRIKTVDMPDTDAERQYIIDKLNEIKVKINHFKKR
jgi:hypothetical protein